MKKCQHINNNRVSIQLIDWGVMTNPNKKIGNKLKPKVILKCFKVECEIKGISSV
jgi:hypothetical protein